MLIANEKTDLKAVDRMGRTCLHIAAAHDLFEVVGTLAEKGAKIDEVYIFNIGMNMGIHQRI